jgi:hypothetical protein
MYRADHIMQTFRLALTMDVAVVMCRRISSIDCIIREELD